jgi:hypothetical protein
VSHTDRTDRVRDRAGSCCGWAASGIPATRPESADEALEFDAIVRREYADVGNGARTEQAQRLIAQRTVLGKSRAGRGVVGAPNVLSPRRNHNPNGPDLAHQLGSSVWTTSGSRSASTRTGA